MRFKFTIIVTYKDGQTSKIYAYTRPEAREIKKKAEKANNVDNARIEPMR
jgi:hypothetical protein